MNKCKTCGNEIDDFPSRKRIYCSKKCSIKRLFGNRFSVGRKHTKEELGKMRQKMLGRHSNEKNPMWKGDKVKYQALHQWVARHLGTPQRCDGKNCSGQSKRYHWANKSGKYKRDFSDWIRLCISCHLTMDWNRPEKMWLKKLRKEQMLGNKHAIKKNNT